MPKKVPFVFSHWFHLTENLQESSQQFYGLVEGAVKQRNLPEVRLSRIDYREGGIFSAKREYLRVERKEHVFDICAAPFGNGFFISWWLGETTTALWDILLMVPFIGTWLMNVVRPTTYYRLDTALMFQESVHSAILEVLDKITNEKGLRALSELERKPILKELFKK